MRAYLRTPQVLHMAAKLALTLTIKRLRRSIILVHLRNVQTLLDALTLFRIHLWHQHFEDYNWEIGFIDPPYSLEYWQAAILRRGQGQISKKVCACAMGVAQSLAVFSKPKHSIKIIDIMYNRSCVMNTYIVWNGFEHYTVKWRPCNVIAKMLLMHSLGEGGE